MISDGIPPVVVYDANVLYPMHLRNLLVQLGAEKIVAPRWSDAINDEWIRSLVSLGRHSRERLNTACDLMNLALPDADVRGYETIIPSLTMPDPDDRHVLAAAIEARACKIVTFNTRDFPNSTLSPFGVAAINPDDFLSDLYQRDPDVMSSVLEAARLNLKRTRPSQEAYFDILIRQGLVKFVAMCRCSPTPAA